MTDLSIPAARPAPSSHGLHTPAAPRPGQAGGPPLAAVPLRNRRLVGIAWGTVALYVLLAVCLTHMPKPPVPVEEIGDKRLHTVGYFLYASVIYVAAGITWPRFRPLAMVVVLVLALWAAADEITQPYFGRTCDIMDWRADMIGVIAAIVALATLRFVARRMEKRANARSVDAA